MWYIRLLGVLPLRLAGQDVVVAGQGQRVLQVGRLAPAENGSVHVAHGGGSQSFDFIKKFSIYIF